VLSFSNKEVLSTSDNYLKKQGAETVRSYNTWFHTETEQHTPQGIVIIMFPYSDISRSIEFDKFGFICLQRILYAKSKITIVTYNCVQVTL